MKRPAISHIAYLLLLVIVTGCSGVDKRRNEALRDKMPPMDSGEGVANVDTLSKQEQADEDFTFSGTDEILDYMASHTDSSAYSRGIIPTIAQHVPDYAAKLLANPFPRFIVVDKASMQVLLYDRFGVLEKQYGMACAKNYGTKHKKADSRTPEGFFSIEGKYNSTDWLYTDDDGRTSDKKGQFGPRFIRIKIPATSQIGIHGTCSPWSIGHRASHGCIRLTNENILELVELVDSGMPVIILPGKRDRAVNRQEGYSIPYFPTNPKYAMSEAESKMKPRSREEIEREKKRIAAEASTVARDSVSSERGVPGEDHNGSGDSGTAKKAENDTVFSAHD